MADLENVLRSWQRANTILSIHQEIQPSGIYRLAEEIRQKTAAIIDRQMLSFDNIARATMFLSKHDLSYLDGINDWLNRVTKYQNIIPKVFHSNFHQAISSQQSIIDNLFNVNNSFELATKHIVQANVLCRATGYLSASLFYKTLKHKDWLAFNEITPYYQRVASITETIKEEQTVTNEILQKFETLLIEVKAQLSIVTAKGGKTLLKVLSNLINLIGFLIGIYCLYLTESDSSNSSALKQTFDKVDQVKTDIEHHLDSLLNSNLKVKARIDCPIKAKPISNSGIIVGLKKNEFISLLDSCKKYYLVIYRKEVNDYPITGWILKKHTSAK